MPVKQGSLNFPIRKSARHKQKENKENTLPTLKDSGDSFTSHISVTSSKPSNDRSLHRTPVKSAAQKCTTTPTKRNAAIILSDDSSPNKRRAAKETPHTAITPPSPSVLSNDNSTLRSSVRVTARKQLVLESFENIPIQDYSAQQHLCEPAITSRSSPRKQSLTKCCGLCEQPQRPSLSDSPRKSSTRICSSPKKFLTLSDSSPKKILTLSDSSPNKSLRKVLSPRKSAREDCLSPRKNSINKNGIGKCLSNENKPFLNKTSDKSIPMNKEVLSQAKCALNTQQPQQLFCRDNEIKKISTFLDSHVEADKPGSLYISGAPGTGKTAVIRHLLEQRNRGLSQKIFINCMTVKSPFSMYKMIAKELIGDSTTLPKNSKSICSLIMKHLVSSGKMVLLVLDELDQLDSRHQEVLYTVFEWPSLSHSRLLLIGIANALDLTDRILPRLNGRAGSRPELLHFPPYTKDEIVTVIESRLKQRPEATYQVLDKPAMLLCARKVSAVAGDMRKALDIFRRSVELTQLAGRKDELLRAKGGSPVASRQGQATVGIMQVAKVVEDVYGSASSAASSCTFPLQQKLIVCTLLLMLKTSKFKEMNLGKVHDAYCRVCRKQDVAPTDQSEFVSLCQLLETRGLIALKKAKDTRMMKMALKMDTKELEFALKDKLLISSVLEGGL